MKKKIVFPFSGTLVGGSYISSSLIMKEINAKFDFEVKAVLPGKGPNTTVFKEVGVDTEYYNLSNEDIIKLRYSAGYINKFKNIPSYTRVYKKALNYLKEIQPDIVHINDDNTVLTWGKAAKKLNIPVIWHVRQEKGNKLLDRKRLKIASYVIFIANSTFKRFSYKTLKRNKKVIYNGVDTQNYKPVQNKVEQKKKMGLDYTKKTIGYIGNLKTAKRPEWFVQAALDLIEKGYDFEAILVGEDHENYTEHINNMLDANQKAKERVQLIGYSCTPEEWFKALDLFCLPSISEPFGRVVIEAMACEVSVLATNSGGVPEIIDDGLDGMLCDATEYNDFVDKLEHLLRDQSKLNELKVNSRDKAVKKFSYKRTAHEVQKVYVEIINNKSGKGKL